MKRSRGCELPGTFNPMIMGVESSGVAGVEPSGVEIAGLFDVVGTASKDVDGVRAILARMECSF
jgi:hypothetical protein